MRALFFLLILCNSVFCQDSTSSKFSFSVGTNPFIYTPNFVSELNFANRGEEIIFSKNKQYSSEFYLTTNYRLNNKWKVGVGISYTIINSNFSNYIETSEWQNSLPTDPYYARLGSSIEFKNELRVNYLGFKFQGSCKLNEANSLTLGVTFQKLIKAELKDDLFGESIGVNSEIREVTGAFFDDKEGVFIVPEIYIETQLYKNLNFIYGAKMRFWNNKSKSLYHLTYKYYDYTVIDYTISTRYLGFFIGFNYQFNL